MAGSIKKNSKVHQEYIEAVDSSNRPLAVLPRAEVHRQGLFHRTVIVLVYDRDHRLLIQKRHRSKSLYPGRWDLSATGHLKAGESATDGAMRELREEVGVAPKALRLATIINGSSETNFEFIYLFNAGRVKFSPSPNPEEVEETMFIDRDDMESLVSEFPDILTPGLVYFWRRQLLFPRL
ncbi:NUDIX hydrolase [Desulfonatronovibrio hydrogenovorans]|uniref:NUDIX hydrolase n=1 Tax=Desulfonatronovibrio hydrogenovorans TaxID=53245 RepID=UPI00068F8507|nr:NUDIX domain-containing protein [Desulfonatronovibrio hydrogenovorans]